jgi:aryl-alcohol dehydrogenase-like predicted oxidoreductase
LADGGRSDRSRVENLFGIAERGVLMAQVALAWVLKNSFVLSRIVEPSALQSSFTREMRRFGPVESAAGL